MGSSATMPEPVDVGRLKRARTFRRVGLALLGAIVLLGMANLLGVRSGSVADEGAGYRLTVTYPSVARPGLASPWSAEVSRPGGLGGPITLATTAGYLALFDQNGIWPQPATSAFRDGRMVWRFDPVEGETFRVDLDVRLEPGVQLGKSGETLLLVDGRRVAAVRYTTRVAP